MGKVSKRWVVATCPTCACRRVFLLTEGWVFVCAECGTVRHLEGNGLLAVA